MRGWPESLWVLAAVIAALCALVAMTRDASEPSSSNTGEAPCPGICGRVTVAGSGESLTRYTLTLFAAGRPAIQRSQFKFPAGYPVPRGEVVATHQISAADGTFAIPMPDADLVYVGVWAPGYWPGETEAIKAGAAPVEIVLERRGKVTLKLVDERGAPVAGSAIHYDNPSRPLVEVLQSKAQDRPVLTSDQRGEVVLDEPFLAGLSILVLGESKIPARVNIEKGRRELVVELRGGVALHGVTRSHDGMPIAAAVEARCESIEPIRTLSRADGSFTFAALPRERCELIVSEDEVDGGRSLGPIQGLARVDLARGAAAVELTIPPSGVVRGRMTGLEITRSGYSVEARSGDETVRFEGGTNGSFWRRLPPARWELRGSFDEDGMHLETEKVVVDVKAGEQRLADLAFAKGASVRITVNDRPLTSAITLQPAAPGLSTRTRIAPTHDGRFEAFGLENGTYRVRFNYGSSQLEASLVVPSSQSVIAAQLHDARIRLTDRHGTPVRGGISIVSIDRRSEAVDVVGMKDKVFFELGNGEYVLHEIVAGTYRLAVQAPGYREAQARIEVPGDETAVALDARDRPFPRPAEPRAANDDELAVLRLVAGDLASWAGAWWKSGGETRGRLVVADETISRSSLGEVWFDRDEDAVAYEKLERSDVMRRYAKTDGVIRRMPGESLRGILVVPFDELPLHTPDRWGEAESEADLFDLSEIADRWDKASGFAFLTTPEISGDGTEAMAVATLYLTNGPMVIRLYWLEKRGARWRVRSQIDVGEGGC